jgi:sec-independent protein translocase protein TatA
MRSITTTASILIVAFLVASSQAFAPVSRAFRSTAAVPSTLAFTNAVFAPTAALQRQRKSVAPVQTMGLFGLGAPEIAVILIAAAFLLGPQKLAELGKDAGKIAGELKEVPKEFQAGLKEGEQAAQSMKQSNVVEAKKEEVEEKKE